MSNNKYLDCGSRNMTNIDINLLLLRFDAAVSRPNQTTFKATLELLPHASCVSFAVAVAKPTLAKIGDPKVLVVAEAAIAVTERWLLGKATAEECQAATDAANAADAADAATDAAAYAAYAATDAAYAAYAAADAANAATDDWQHALQELRVAVAAQLPLDTCELVRMSV